VPLARRPPPAAAPAGREKRLFVLSRL